MASKFGQGTQSFEEGTKQVGFAKTQYFGIDDGKSEIVRFITDSDPHDHLEGWINVTQHSGVATRPKPDWQPKDRDWPQGFGVVCRNTKCKGLPGEPPLWSVMEDKEHEGCYVCLNLRQTSGKNAGKPYRSATRGWALGCLREPVREEGRITGYQDKIREVEKDGQPVKERDIQIFNMGWKNFFSTLSGYASHFGTAVDRDYMITRIGTGLDTDYRIIPLDAIPGYDLRDPEVFKLYDTELSLDDEIEQQARWDWMRRWFDPTYTPPARDDETPAASNGQVPVAEQAKPPTEIDPDMLDSMASRVTGRYSPTSPTT